jgi:hypothetical protein
MLHDAVDEGHPQAYGLTQLVPFSSVVDKNTRLIPKQPYYDAFKNYPRFIKLSDASPYNLDKSQ